LRTAFVFGTHLMKQLNPTVLNPNENRSPANPIVDMLLDMFGIGGHSQFSNAQMILVHVHLPTAVANRNIHHF